MPVITVQFIKDVVATPDQKRELLVRLTNAFISIVGEVTRPFVYCIIKETPQGEWSIAGVPMPDLAYLSGPVHAKVIDTSNVIMRGAVEQMKAAAAGNAAAASQRELDTRADKIWRGALTPQNSSGTGTADGGHAQTSKDADQIWRGAESPSSSNGNGNGHSQVDYDRLAADLNAEAARANAAAAEAEKARVKRNRAIIDKFYQAVNTRHREVFKEIVHPDFVNHGGSDGEIIGPEALSASLDPFFEAIPDWHVSQDYTVAQGDRVASRGTITGTHLGSFMGHPPTGKKLKWTGIIIYRVSEDGMVMERWQDFDSLGMLQQMGVIPSPQAQPV